MEAAEGPQTQATESASAPRAVNGKEAPAGRSYRATFGESRAEVRLQADISHRLAPYAADAWNLARQTIVGGASEGVVTFEHPLSWDELAALEAMGLEVREIELITEPDKDDLRWTIFIENGPSRAEQVAAVAFEAQVAVLGAISANVVVPNPGTLTRLEKTDAVYLVDLSVTDYKRHNPGLVDISQNDVFWVLAGWD